MYLKCDHFFEAIITTNITCMTVLASLYILFSSVVPQTSYIKLVDIWFLFNLVYPFCLILIHIFIQTSKYEEEKENDDTVKDFVLPPITKETQTIAKSKPSAKKYSKSEIGLLIGHFVLPLFGVSFVIIYFVVGWFQ